jgi:hypothetical protein
MSIVLQSTSGGSVTINEPTTASNFTQSLPAATGTVALLQTPSFATTIGVGGATPSTSGAGITFPATQSASTDANTLDDYEEGTWTPTVSIAGATGITYARRTGLYTKIGNVVHCEMTIDLSNKGTGASAGTAVEIQGLPFTHSSTSNNYPNFFIAAATLATNCVQTSGQIAFGSTTITPIKSTGSTAADAQMVNSDIANTSQFRASFIYLV